MILIENLKKYINSGVYEENAEYPWAKIKDFIISKDGKNIAAAEITTVSLIPVPYIVMFEDFKILDRRRSVLKPGVKPKLKGSGEYGTYFLSQLGKVHLGGEMKRAKIRDASFVVEVGEIVDYIAVSNIIGSKSYLDLSQLKKAEDDFGGKRR